MEFLVTAYSMKGYPLIVFYAIGLTGFLLVGSRPYWAFLLAVFCLAARNFQAAVFTRAPLLGEYCNLNDLLMWIGLLAMVRLTFQERDLWAPKILLAILAINLLGAVDSLTEYGFSAHVQRSLWGAAIFPAMFLVGANLVSSQEKARYFYWALFAGALMAAIQHLFLVDAQINVKGASGGEFDIRSISYVFSGGIFLAVSAIFINVRRLVLRPLIGLIWLGGIGLIALSYVLSLTRTLWVGATFSVLGVWLVTSWQSRQISRVLSRSIYAVFSLLLVIGCIFTISKALFPQLGLEDMIWKRLDFLAHRDVFDKSYETREWAFETEMKLWLEGSLVWGLGTAMPPALAEESIIPGKNSVGALGHVGFSSYLARFGLLGLLVYWVLLPLMTIKTGNRLLREHSRDYIGALALAALALSFYDLATIFSSNHYLGATSHLAGLIYGALWGLSRRGLAQRNLVLIQPQPRTYHLGMEAK
jgi:hypothetical protein